MTKCEIMKVKELEDRIIEFKSNSEKVIVENYRSLLAKIIRIDGNKPVLVSNLANPEDNKEGHVDNQSKLMFSMKENRVMSLDLLSQKLIEIETMKETYLAKLLPTSGQTLLVVGGQSTKQRSTV